MRKLFLLASGTAFALAACSGLPTVGSSAAPRGEAAELVGAVHTAVVDAKARDARYLIVADRPWLAFDQESQRQLAAYPVGGDLKSRQDFLARAVAGAARKGNEAAAVEIARLPAQRLSGLAQAHALPARGEAAETVIVGYTEAATTLAGQDIATVRGMQSSAALDAWHRALTEGTEVSIKVRGRSLRQLLLLPLRPFVAAWMGMHIMSGEDEKPVVADFRDATRYMPPALALAETDPARMSDQDLLGFYAPAIAIEHKQKVSYDPKADRFGKVVMSGTGPDDAQPLIDVDSPTVYTYVETHTIEGQQVKQLVYTFWFPERPKLKGGFDPEVGSTQGAIIRMSLDAANRPVLYENVSSCGCYYKVFPSERLEKLAASQYGAPIKRKKFSLEQDVPRKIDAHIPNLVREGDTPRVMASYTAGAHAIASVEPWSTEEEGAALRYRLMPYEALENLPFNGSTISMFDEDGLVRNADRPEATLLAASGIYHAGTPRQRGTLMIYFDQADFDDPGLLEHYLRLPSGAFNGVASTH
jgi:hypothetical protein